MRGSWKFAFLYFSEGAPIGFIWWALPTLLRSQDVSVAHISALTATLVLPWTFKFVLAPMVDLLRGPYWNLKSWIIFAQIGMGLCLVPLVRIPMDTQFTWWFRLLMLHAVFAALQDVSVDALAVNKVRPEDRGRVNGLMQLGMLAGRGVFGGVSIWMVKEFGIHAVMIALILSIWSTSLLALSFSGETIKKPKLGEYQKLIREMLGKGSMWRGLLFALTAEASFKACGGLAGPLLVDRGASEELSAFFFSVVVVSAMVSGSLLGGFFADKRSRGTAVWATLGLSVSSVILFALCDLAGCELGLLVPLLAFVYLCAGLFTAASYALFMDLSDQRIAALQYSLFMACINGCESWSVALSGRLVSQVGYGGALLFTSLLGMCLAGPVFWFLTPDLQRKE